MAVSNGKTRCISTISRKNRGLRTVYRYSFFFNFSSSKIDVVNFWKEQFFECYLTRGCSFEWRLSSADEALLGWLWKPSQSQFSSLSSATLRQIFPFNIWRSASCNSPYPPNNLAGGFFALFLLISSLISFSFWLITSEIFLICNTHAIYFSLVFFSTDEQFS